MASCCSSSPSPAREIVLEESPQQRVLSRAQESSEDASRSLNRLEEGYVCCSRDSRAQEELIQRSALVLPGISRGFSEVSSVTHTTSPMGEREVDLDTYDDAKLEPSGSDISEPVMPENQGSLDTSPMAERLSSDQEVAPYKCSDAIPKPGGDEVFESDVSPMAKTSSHLILEFDKEVFASVVDESQALCSSFVVDFKNGEEKERIQGETTLNNFWEKLAAFAELNKVESTGSKPQKRTKFKGIKYQSIGRGGYLEIEKFSNNFNTVKQKLLEKLEKKKLEGEAGNQELNSFVEEIMKNLNVNVCTHEKVPYTGSYYLKKIAFKVIDHIERKVSSQASFSKKANNLIDKLKDEVRQKLGDN
jgi:hypothetical protein